jgi:fatty-acyl-CoA synthase
MSALSYAHGAAAAPLLGETIGANLGRTVARVPDALALVVRHQGFRCSYRELWALSSRCARGLLARGVQPGDRVGIWSPNRHEWVVLQYATARLGAILVNLNPAYKTAEVSYALRQSGVSFLVLARAFRQSDYVAMVAEVRPGCPAIRETLVLDEAWEALLAEGDTLPEAALAEIEAKLQFDDPINIQYTSGTTGHPKGATLTHHNLLNNGYFIGEELGYTEADRVCIPVPFYHCFGMVIGNLACTSHGAAMVIPAEAFEPEATLAAVAAERCTSLYGVPTMFIAELDHPSFEQHDLSSLRTGVMAGSPCPIETMKQVISRMHMPEVTICYGMTETSPVSLQSTRHDPLDRRVTTVGRIHPHLEVKLVDPATGAIVPRGQSGELCTRGYSVMQGYWENPEASALAIDQARWMHTGDLATMDEAGYVKIVGRIKDMIIRGGENIYPREIEEYLLSHPAVVDAQVIGVPSLKYGEEVMAWVKLRSPLDEEALVAFCRGRISTFKIPRYWRFVDDFPMTVTGKIQKFRMREVSIAELGLAAAMVETA